MEVAPDRDLDGNLTEYVIIEKGKTHPQSQNTGADLSATSTSE